MNYKKYQKSRNTAWEVLIDHKIVSLPVKVGAICRQDGIVVRSYTQAREFISCMGLTGSTINNDGFAVIVNGESYIFFNERCTVQRQRFTVGHEYGHYIRGHVQEDVPTPRNKEPREDDNEIEAEANVVASRILSPACVLWGLNVHTAEKIATLCDISMESAEWRLKRLELLYVREKEFITKYGKSCFLLSKLEQRVYEQFLPFIESRL